MLQHFLSGEKGDIHKEEMDAVLHTKDELALRREKGGVFFMHFDLLQGLYELYILCQHELSLQFGEYEAEDVGDGGVIQLCKATDTACGKGFFGVHTQGKGLFRGLDIR